MSNHAQPTVQPKLHLARNVAIVTVAIAIVVVAIVAISLSGGFSGILPSSHTVNIVNGLVTVNAGSYEYYQFTVPSGASNIQVSGTFTASGGSGNDIKVYIMDSTNFVNWQNGHMPAPTTIADN